MRFLGATVHVTAVLRIRKLVVTVVHVAAVTTVSPSQLISRRHFLMKNFFINQISLSYGAGCRCRSALTLRSIAKENLVYEIVFH